MSDKFLSESEWKKFAKGRGFKDDALIKGLAALDKAKTPEQELAALADIDKQAEVLRKAAKGDKELGAYLDSLDKAADKQRKLSEAEAKKAEQEQGEDEEEESPVLLTTKMIPLLRQVRKGDEMQVMLASTGKEVAVLMSRRAISPTRRKLLAEYLDGAAPKYFLGTCIFEENAYTFVLRTQAAGLAKKVKAALLKQVELRLKVRVRGEDPNDIDDDGEPADGNEGLEAEGEDGNAGAKGDVRSAPPPPVDPLKAQFDKRWADLQARVLEQLKAGAGDVSKLRAVAEFVREKGAGGNYKAALQGMDTLEKLLPAGTPVPGPVAGGGADPAAAFTARLTALMPEVKTAIAAGGETGQEIKLKVGEAGVLARKKEFEPANALLDEAEALIHQVRPVEPKGPNEQFAALMEKLQPLVDEATGLRVDGPTAELRQKAMAAWNLAAEAAGAGNLDRAVLVLGRLLEGKTFERVIEAARTASANPDGDPQRLVRQRKFMLEEWSKMPGELRTKLTGLRSLLADSEADEDPEDLVDGIEDALEELLEEIKDTMDQAINDGDTAVFKGLRERARSHELMQHLMTAPDFDGGALLDSVESALERIERAMLAA